MDFNVLIGEFPRQPAGPDADFLNIGWSSLPGSAQLKSELIGAFVGTPALKKAAAKSKPPEAAPAASLFNASKYAVGDLISHPMFGNGTVLAIDATKLTIKFDRNVVKQIVEDYVKPGKL